MLAASSRLTTSSLASVWKMRLISSVRSVRCVTRRLFEENRGSAASSGLRSTDSQKTAHSRWFWMPMKTSFPS
jgi:hypothetical protein